MHLFHRGVGVILLHPMVQHGFQICCCNVPNNFASYQREHLVLGSAFQAVVGGALYRWEFENLQPMRQAVLERFLRFVRVTHLCVELCDVGCYFLLGLRLGFAGEGLSFLLSLLIEVPNDALPAAISTSEHVAVCSESFLWHG